jgi:hypothetical protein
MISSGGNDAAFFGRCCGSYRHFGGESRVCSGRYSGEQIPAGPDFALLEMQSLCKLYS